MILKDLSGLIDPFFHFFVFCPQRPPLEHRFRPLWTMRPEKLVDDNLPFSSANPEIVQTNPGSAGILPALGLKALTRSEKRARCPRSQDSFTSFRIHNPETRCS